MGSMNSAMSIEALQKGGQLWDPVPGDMLSVTRDETQVCIYTVLLVTV